jgi:hypothetical protein
VYTVSDNWHCPPDKPDFKAVLFILDNHKDLAKEISSIPSYSRDVELVVQRFFNLAVKDRFISEFSQILWNF